MCELNYQLGAAIYTIRAASIDIHTFRQNWIWDMAKRRVLRPAKQWYNKDKTRESLGHIGESLPKSYIIAEMSPLRRPCEHVCALCRLERNRHVVHHCTKAWLCCETAMNHIETEANLLAPHAPIGDASPTYMNQPTLHRNLPSPVECFERIIRTLARTFHSRATPFTTLLSLPLPLPLLKSTSSLPSMIASTDWDLEHDHE